jgi:ribosomal protein S16
MATETEINDLYNDLFGRDAAAEGLDYWASSGISAADMESALISGAGETDAAYYQDSVDTAKDAEINVMYNDLFGRDAKQEGLDYWSDSGISMDDMEKSLIAGAGEVDTAYYDDAAYTAKETEINNMYNGLFGRDAKQEGLDYWMESGIEMDDMAQALFASAGEEDAEAYRGRYINYLYNDLFGRDATQEGLDYWLNSDTTLAGMQSAMIGGAGEEDAAYYQNSLKEDEINSMYNELFGRDAKQEGIDYWMGSGVGMEDMRKALVAGAGPEDTAAHERSLREGEINSLYNELFGRDATQEGLDYWADSDTAIGDMKSALLGGANAEDAAYYDNNVTKSLMWNYATGSQEMMTQGEYDAALGNINPELYWDNFYNSAGYATPMLSGLPSMPFAA